MKEGVGHGVNEGSAAVRQRGSSHVPRVLTAVSDGYFRRSEPPDPTNCSREGEKEWMVRKREV